MNENYINYNAPSSRGCRKAAEPVIQLTPQQEIRIAYYQPSPHNPPSFRKIFFASRKKIYPESDLFYSRLPLKEG